MKKILAIDFSTASKKDEGTGYAFRKDGQLYVGSIKAYHSKKNAWERTFDIVNAIKDIINEFDLKDYHLAIETPIMWFVLSNLNIPPVIKCKLSGTSL